MISLYQRAKLRVILVLGINIVLLGFIAYHFIKNIYRPITNIDAALHFLEDSQDELFFNIQDDTPSITHNFVKNNHEEVRNKINKSLQMLLYVTIPMTIGLSILAKPVWTVFYQYDEMCSSVFSFYIFMALANSTLATLNAVIQALNYQKIMFINISIGFIIKVTLNIPFMYLADRVGLNPGYGAVLATILGYSSSVLMNLLFLKRKLKVNYRSTIKKVLKITACCLVMVIVVTLLKVILPFNIASKSRALIAIVIYGGIGALTYFILTYKMNLIHNIFGEEFINKVLHKLKIKKQMKEK
jgi:O-antigen/teichoic acid export membrane protein